MTGRLASLNGSSQTLWRGPSQSKVGRLQRIARQHVLDVGQQQLLMLLLVVAAELQQVPDAGPVAGGRGQEVAQRFLDMGPVGQHVAQRRA